MANVNTTNPTEELFIYHLCSKGEASFDLFTTQDDFQNAMNLVAFCKLKTQVEMLAFCIMNNHFHFVLKATRIQGIEFASLLENRYNRWRSAQNLYKIEALEWSLEIVPDSDAYKVIGYVLRNPLVFWDRIPQDYKFSTCSLYFRTPEYFEELHKCFLTPVGEMSVRELRRSTNSKIEWPTDWLMTKDGYIWPGSYVNIKLVERYFYKMSTYFYYITSNKIETEDITKSFNNSRILLNDGELSYKAITLAKELTGKDTIAELSIDQRLKIAEKLNVTYGSPMSQLYRILGLRSTKI